MLSGALKRNPAAENGTSIIDVKSRLRVEEDKNVGLNLDIFSSRVALWRSA